MATRVLYEQMKRWPDWSDLLSVTDVSPDAFTAYVQWMALKAKTVDVDGRLLSPPPAVDDFWHHHIQFTGNYAAFCRAFCDGGFLNHNPLLGQDVHAQRVRRRRANALFERAFGALSPVWAADADDVAIQSPPSPPLPDDDDVRRVRRRLLAPHDARLIVRSVTGETEYPVVVNLRTSLCVEIKEQILPSSGIPVEQQRLIVNGQQLDDLELLSKYSIGHDTPITLVLRLRGC